MAAAIPFDTLAFVKELETAGVPAAQAEAHAKTLVITFQKVEESRRMDFATKGDVEELKRERERLATKGDIEELKREREGLATKGDVESLKKEREELATKGDIESVRRDIDSVRKEVADVRAELRKDVGEIRKDLEEIRLDFKVMETKFDSRFKELELRMVIKTGGMILAGIGLLFGLMRTWPLPVQYAPPPQVFQETPAYHPPTAPLQR